MDCSIPGLPAHCQLPELAETHIHGVGDAMQPSRPLSSLLLPPSIFPRIRVFSKESFLCIRCQSIWASASESVLPVLLGPGEAQQRQCRQSVFGPFPELSRWYHQQIPVLTFGVSKWFYKVAPSGCKLTLMISFFLLGRIYVGIIPATPWEWQTLGPYALLSAAVRWLKTMASMQPSPWLTKLVCSVFSLSWPNQTLVTAATGTSILVN